MLRGEAGIWHKEDRAWLLMTPEFAVELLKNTMFQAATLVAPLLVTGMLVGLCESLFQAVTTIHEQTLTFVPKAAAVLIVMIFLLPWMIRSVVEFTTLLIEKMPGMAR